MDRARTIVNDMRTSRAIKQQGGSPPVLLLAVAFVLFGILGMHALSNHGVTHGSTASTAHDAPAATSAVDDADQHASPGASEHGSTVPSGDHHSGMAMTMLCLGLLVGLGGIAFLSRGRSGVLWSLSRSLAARPLRPRRTLRLATGPPPVWEFSIIRC